MEDPTNASIPPAAWVGAGALIVGVLVAECLAWWREWRRQSNERHNIRRSLYHEVADRVGRCLNDYIDPWARYHNWTLPQGEPMPIRRLLKFRPVEPVMYPNLAARLGLLSDEILAPVTHFFFRLDAIRRDIDHWGLMQDLDTDLAAKGDTRLIARRFGDALGSGLKALEALSYEGSRAEG